MKLYETITAENWWKGGFGAGAGRLCLGWHVVRAGSSKCIPLENAIRMLYPDRLTDARMESIIVRFNDHPPRSKT